MTFTETILFYSAIAMSAVSLTVIVFCAAGLFLIAKDKFKEMTHR